MVIDPPGRVTRTIAGDVMRFRGEHRTEDRDHAVELVVAVVHQVTCVAVLERDVRQT